MENQKVAFVPKAELPTRVIPVEETLEPSKGKIGIKHEYKPAGRPPKEGKLMLPPGYQTLRRGRSEYSEQYGEEFLLAYYESGGSITRACRETNTQFAAVKLWMRERPEFAEAIQEVDTIIREEVHSQFMTRVLNEWEPNPAWKFKYFNKHFPEYSETKKQVKVSFNLKDTLIRPEIIEGEVIKKELVPENATRPKQLLEAPPNTG